MSKLPTRKVQRDSASFAFGVICSAGVGLNNYANNQYGLTKDEQSKIVQIVKQLDDLSNDIDKRLKAEDS